MNLTPVTFCFIFSLSQFASDLTVANCLDKSPAEDEVSYLPEDGAITETNPPAFVWLPHETLDKYVVQYSQSRDFERNSTVTVRNLDITLYIPQETMQTGQWYGGYGYSNKNKECFSKIRAFEIPADAVDFPFITADNILSPISRERSCIFFTPDVVSDICSDETGSINPEIKTIISMADITLKMNEPLFESDPWEEYEDFEQVYSEIGQTMRPYTQRLVMSAMAYLFTGEEKYAEEAGQRLMNFMELDGDEKQVSAADYSITSSMEVMPGFLRL